MQLTIKIHEGFTQWYLLPYGSDKNAPIQITQQNSSNDHLKNWNYFKISPYFE